MLFVVLWLHESLGLVGGKVFSGRLGVAISMEFYHWVPPVISVIIMWAIAGSSM